MKRTPETEIMDEYDVSGYLVFVKTRTYIERILPRFLDQIPAPVEGGTILIVGCGEGSEARALAEKFPLTEIHGIDITPQMISVAQSQGSYDGRIHYQEGDAKNIPFPDGYFNITVSNHLVHHFDTLENGAKALKEHLRVTSKPGHVIVGDVLVVDPLEFYLSVLGREYSDDVRMIVRDSYQAAYSRKEFDRMFEESGLLDPHPGFVPDISVIENMVPLRDTDNDIVYRNPHYILFRRSDVAIC